MTTVTEPRLGFEYMPLDALRIGDAHTYLIPHLRELSVAAVGGGVDALPEACEHHPREVGAKWNDGWQDHFVTWAFDVCEHGRWLIVMTTNVHETTQPNHTHSIGLTPYQRGFLETAKSDKPFHDEMQRIFLEWNARGTDITRSPEWALVVAPFSH